MLYSPCFFILIGDSHARGNAANISSYLGEDFEIMGTVMPGFNRKVQKIMKANRKCECSSYKFE
jgi:thiamine monophosphate kinase